MREIRFRRPDFQGKLRSARKFERRPDHASRRFRFAKIIAALLLLAIGYFIFVSRVFVITKTSDAAAAATLRRLARERRYLIPKSHFVALDEKRFLAELQKDNLEVRRIRKFRKILPNRLEAEMEMRELRYVFQTAGTQYYLDQEGVVYAPATQAPGTTPVLLDRSNAPAGLGQPLADPRIIKFLNAIYEQWAQNIRQTKYQSFAVEAVGQPDLFVKTDIGYEVYFDLDRSAGVQLQNLNLVLAREIPPETYSGLSYIDLRLPAYAYYCYKDAPCSPEYRVENGE